MAVAVVVHQGDVQTQKSRTASILWISGQNNKAYAILTCTTCVWHLQKLQTRATRLDADCRIKVGHMKIVQQQTEQQG